MANRFPFSSVRMAGVSSAAILLSACATSQPQTDIVSDPSGKEYKAAIGVHSNPEGDENMDPIAAAAFWGTRYNTDQSDPHVAVKFSRSLRRIGSLKEATEVMQKASSRFAGDPNVNLEYGKVLVEGGRAFEAVPYLEEAASTSPNDWSVLSAYGVALDQIGEHALARQKYDRALSFAPSSQSVLNNKGLSFALDGKLAQARATLRQAAATTRAGGNARIRQNLALVLAISGDMREAERLSRSDLPPLVADNNVEFYRQLTSQPAYWDEYAATDVEVPTFDDVPAAPIIQKSKPKPSVTPAPQLRVEPRAEDKNDGAPIALSTGVTEPATASAPAAADLFEDKGESIYIAPDVEIYVDPAEDE